MTIRLLTFTTLYPNAKRPAHGVFVENRLRHLLADGGATSLVVAPVPYVPRGVGLPGRYNVLSDVPAREPRHGIEVRHPRYFLLPKISMQAAPLSIYFAAKRQLSTLRAEGHDFDLIDAHYFYPDGVAAVMLARHFGKPVTVTARGSDITQLPQYRLPRKMIQWAAREADGIITVCEALKAALIQLGTPGEKIRVLRNGVDLSLFRPVSRDEVRQRLGFSGMSILSVGHLIPRKGHDLALQALVYLPAVQLSIVGDGPDLGKLQQQAQRLGVGDRVRFLGQVAHEQLAEFYSAADLTLLLSTQEGWANVLLESMACGTPVVATDVGGTSEVMTAPLVGELVHARDPVVVARTITTVLARGAPREAIRSFAEGFGWGETSRGQLDLFSEILRARKGQGSTLGTAHGLGLRLPGSVKSEPLNRWGK